MKDLFHNVIYKFHRIGFYFYSVKYYYQDHSPGKSKFKCFFTSIFKQLKIFNYKSLYYEYLEIPITTKCSLFCKHCSNLIPCYKKRFDYDVNDLIRSIKEFLNCVEQIVYVRVLGGEPFLSANLCDVLKVLLRSDKIQRIEVVTNGTIVPSDRRIIRLLRNKRIIVCISKYPMVDYEKVVKFLKGNNIKYRVDNMSYWMDYGDTTERGKSYKELKKQFSKCHSVCKSLVNGQVHLCPRSSHGTDLGIIKDNSDDYVDLLDENLSIDDKKKKLIELSRKKCIKACDYCIYGTKESKKISVAEQIKYHKS